MPLAMVPAPGGRRLVVLLNGWRQQGVQVVDRTTGKVTQTLRQPAAFLGLAFAPNGRTLYASGGNQDVIYRYAWSGDSATLRDSLILATRAPGKDGTRYPAGLALSADGLMLYAAENLADSLAVIDLRTGQVIQRFPTERYPYGVLVSPSGTVFVSAWGGSTVSVFTARGASLVAAGRITVGRHPSAMALGPDGKRLFVALASVDRVAVVNLSDRRLVRTLADPPPAGPGEGSTPDALALSADGSRLFVAEADNNAVAVFDLSPGTAGVENATGNDSLAGRIPVPWYPTALVRDGDSLLVLAGKGRHTGPNPDGPVPGKPLQNPHAYTLGQTDGTITVLPVPDDRGALASLNARVHRANGWDRARTPSKYPPFAHVIYVVKENRTYDQLLGDLTAGDGDTALVLFPRNVSPNHHALAERFGLFDRFFVNADVSADGHNWTMAAYATDYTIKTTPSQYSNRGRSYDYEGANRDSLVSDDDDVAAPASGYLWNAALARGLSVRNYGEFAVAEPDSAGGRALATKSAMRERTAPDFAPFDMSVSDQRRADAWIAELQSFARTGMMPALEIIHLPNDHTAGAAPGKPTPRAYLADNDLALGRMVEALSRTPFWASTVVFVLEDDAQNGADHVDSHRAPMLVISPYNHAGVVHRFANTTDVLATIEEILHLDALSHFDYFGRPLRDIFAAEPDLRPYAALMPAQSLTEMNPTTGRAATESARLDLRTADAIDDDRFAEIVWRAVKGDAVPFPGARRMSSLEEARAR